MEAKRMTWMLHSLCLLESARVKLTSSVERKKHGDVWNCLIYWFDREWGDLLLLLRAIESRLSGKVALRLMSPFVGIDIQEVHSCSDKFSLIGWTPLYSSEQSYTLVIKSWSLRHPSEPKLHP
jgi:hypothetical protein